MKKNKIILSLFGAGVAMAALTQSCVSDQPFVGSEGEGTLRMKLVINSDLTRAIVDDQNLKDSCVVYISGASGLIHKYKGFNNIPESVPLKSGNYVLEAWTGDSVPASFESKFYRGYKKFSITDGDNTSVSLTCGIANVVVSVNARTFDIDEMKDWTLTVSNSRGELTFDSSNMDSAKGYFMMPNSDIARDAEGNIRKDGEGWALYTNLNYKIEGKTAAGESFSKTGPIGVNKLDTDNNDIVEHAHDYVLNLVYDPEYEATGGSLISIRVDDTEVEQTPYEFGIYSKPAIQGFDFDIEEQVVGAAGQFTEDVIVKVGAFYGLTNLSISTPDYEAAELPGELVDIANLASDNQKAILEEKGLSWKRSYKEDVNFETAYLIFSTKLLNKLPKRDEQFVFTITAKDKSGKSNTVDLQIATDASAIIVKEPVTIDAGQLIDDLMAVGATKATINGILNNDEAENPRLCYSVRNANEWVEVPIPLTRSGREFSVTLTNLTPGTEYQMYATADGFEKPAASKHIIFKTESKFELPNSSMEDWSNYTSKIIIPGAGGVRTFWDTGNHGSSTLSVTLTNSSTDMVHSGKYSAKLRSQFVGITSSIGKFAAGNLFVGEYAETKGTNGVINFGREYDGSHPTALSVWVNYKPEAATSKTKGSHVPQGALDEGQIYIAFTTGKVRVDTSDTKTLFSKDKEEVLGYGEFNFTEAYGENGGLKNLVIPVEWKPSASTTVPTHIIIVCSASRYGDYFEGGDGSTMYLDDFELVY